MRSKSPVYDFVVVLKNRNQRAVRLTGMLLSLFSLFLFLYRSFWQNGSRMNLLFFFAILILMTWTILQIRKKERVRFALLLSIAGFGLLGVQPFSWLGFIFIVMAFLEKEAFKAQEIGFSRKHIRMDGMIKKDYEWSELSNVMLKDGILTMDFMNNKLFQREADDADDPEYDGSEDEFNEFCASQLKLTRN